MTRPSIPSLSRRLSWLLRHGASHRGLAMDEAGWASVADVLAVAGMTRAQLVAAVEHNDKRRFQLEGDRIRACQGHSLAAMPVTRDALEASWEPYLDDDLHWHGTSRAVLPSITEHGILPGNRSHVHLAPAPDSRIGLRAGVEVILAVSPPHVRAAGLTVFRAPNGVLLVRHVPVGCIVDGACTEFAVT